MKATSVGSGQRTFRQRLREATKFHMGKGDVHETVECLARDLQEAGIDYAIVGAIALNAHGYRRETVDVDVLVTPGGLETFHERLVGRGYRPAFSGARKTFVNTRTNTRVDFLISGEYPGDGRPKPVAFPDPSAVAVDVEGIPIANLATLVELKLASGMTQPARRRDLADVQDLIRILGLDASFADSLNPFVQETFRMLVAEVQADRAGPE